jgi:hypothetical protein
VHVGRFPPGRAAIQTASAIQRNAPDGHFRAQRLPGVAVRVTTLSGVPCLVAVVPEPPLLVPELATGAAAETAALRTACREAAARLAEASSEWIVVGADGGGRRTVGPGIRGSFIGFGADVTVALGPDASDPADPDLPLPLLVAGWLRPDGVTVRGELVAPDTAPGDCLALGAALAAEDAALLVVGDGAATHTAKAPGHLDERAGPFDEAVAAALRTGDPDALAALDPDLAAQLWSSGRAPWQVLAGAARGRSWQAELLHSSIPFGVAYHVALWHPA